MLRIAASAHAAMLAHCRREMPREAVGLLSGRGQVAERADELPNIAPPPHDRRAFLADPYRQFLAERRIAAAGMHPIAVYHSHPEGSAVLSLEDVTALDLRSRMQVVVALSTTRPAREMTRVFRLGSRGIVAGELTVLDDRAAY